MVFLATKLNGEAGHGSDEGKTWRFILNRWSRYDARVRLFRPVGWGTCCEDRSGTAYGSRGREVRRGYKRTWPCCSLFVQMVRLISVLPSCSLFFTVLEHSRVKMKFTAAGLVSGLVGSASAVQYGYNHVAVRPDSEAVASAFEDVDIDLFSPAFIDEKGRLPAFSEGTKGPSTQDTIGRRSSKSSHTMYKRLVLTLAIRGLHGGGCRPQ